MKKMTLAEALQVGISTTVIGLVIVFAVLIILMGVLMLFNRIFSKSDKKAVEQPKASAPIQTSAPQANVMPREENDEELIAILTAAVAASLNTSTYNLKIKSYRRIQDNAPAWNKAGIKETIESRF